MRHPHWFQAGAGPTLFGDWSGAMTLGHIGEKEGGHTIVDAIERVLREKDPAHA